jgi:hypothetical protein
VPITVVVAPAWLTIAAGSAGMAVMAAAELGRAAVVVAALLLHATALAPMTTAPAASSNRTECLPLWLGGVHGNCVVAPAPGRDRIGVVIYPGEKRERAYSAGNPIPEGIEVCPAKDDGSSPSAADADDCEQFPHPVAQGRDRRSPYRHLLYRIALADPALVVNGSGACLAVVASILVPQFILHKYRMARGRELAKATRKAERYVLTSPDTYSLAPRPSDNYHDPSRSRVPCPGLLSG